MEREYEANYCGVYNGRALFSCPRCTRYLHTSGTHIKCTSCGSRLVVRNPAANDFITNEDD